MLTLVRNQIAPDRKSSPGSRRLADLKGQSATLLLLVAHAGTRTDAAGDRREAVQAALAAGFAEMGIADAVPPPGALTLDAAGGALEALKALAPLQKALLIKGLFAAVTADGKIRLAEAELMRLTGAVLDCPLPPLLEELDPATLVD